MKKLSKSGGFTLIEIIIVLAIIGMLAGILAPTLVKYVQSAKLRRATDDVKMIGTAIGNFYNDMGEWPVWAAGNAMTSAGTMYNLLRGPGDDPGMDADIPAWTLSGATVSDLEDHLGTNDPNGNGTPNEAADYPITGRNAWRGPYIEQFRADPWGNAYLVNVEFVQPANEQGQTATFVLSAGPNESVETEYDQTAGAPGMTVGGDDIVFRIK